MADGKPKTPHPTPPSHVDRLNRERDRIRDVRNTVNDARKRLSSSDPTMNTGQQACIRLAEKSLETATDRLDNAIHAVKRAVYYAERGAAETTEPLTPRTTPPNPLTRSSATRSGTGSLPPHTAPPPSEPLRSHPAYFPNLHKQGSSPQPAGTTPIPTPRTRSDNRFPSRTGTNPSCGTTFPILPTDRRL